MSTHDPSHTTPDFPPPLTFISIDSETPARAFWLSLARLLFALASAARRRGEPRR